MKTMNTPTLRFKEFSGAWEVKKVGDVCDCIVPGRNKPIEFNGDIPWITTPDIEQNGLVVRSKKNLNITLEESKNVGSKIVPKNSIVISCVGELGLVAITGVDLIINQQLHAFIPKESVYFKFLLYALTIQKPYMEKVATKTALPYMNKDNCNSIPVFLPPLTEQTKIANFLTAIDEKIAQLTQTAQLLTDYKKGVMQQIFSQQLRFKDDDGREFAEWDFIELEKVAFKVNAKNKDCSITNVLTNSATQGIVNQADYFDRDIANQNNLGGYYVVEIDDFVYNPRISNHALVGSLKRNNLVKGVMSPLYTVFRFKNGSLPFFEQYFETTHWHDYMKSVANSGARHDRLNITNDDFLNLPVPFPSLPEQTKIANFLTAIDDKINNNQTQLDAMKQYKSGLLQQMFV